MGNSSTKEQRPPAPSSPSQSQQDRIRHPRSQSASGTLGLSSSSHSSEPGPSSPYASRHGRGSRPDLSFLGIGSNTDRDTAGLEIRRETKQEREARKAEKERLVRGRERERSMREESVDGGYLVTQGVYIGPEDYNRVVVRQLMIERRLAPFFKGLNDYSATWSDEQLVAAVRGQPISDDPATTTSQTDSKSTITTASGVQHAEKSLKNATVDISPRSQSFNSDHSTNLSPSHPAFPLTASNSPPGLTPSSSSSIFRPRSKTLASLTTLSKGGSQTELTPQEIHLPKASLVDGRPIEALVYKDATECPICFLYYPAHLNRTRCCDQPICSECFVQIKRPDPHPPEHGDPTTSVSGADLRAREDGGANLVSEAAACPFCVQPEFGITYDPPPFRTGLAYANHPSAHPLANATSAMSSSSSLSSFSGTINGPLLSPSLPSRRRTTSISASSPAVITTDRIRPDWAQKLANARAHAARRSAAATALHTAAYLMGGVSGTEGRSFAGFGRRSRLSRSLGTTDGIAATRSLLAQPGTEMNPGNGLGGGSNRDGASFIQEEGGESNGPYAEQGTAPSRRSRLDDLEDMMMMEAIRLSLATEEERKKKEEKEAKKEAKQKGKETKKFAKGARKSSQAVNDLETTSGLGESSKSGGSSNPDDTAPTDKGKGVDRRVASSSTSVIPPPLERPLSTEPHPPSSSGIPGEHGSSPQVQAGRSEDQLQSSGLTGCPPRPEKGVMGPSPLQHVSRSSSPATSFIESAPGSIRSGLHGSTSSFDASPNASTTKVGGSKSGDITRASTPSGGAGTESMFNFRSLAAMIGDDDKHDETRPTEDSDASTQKLSPPSKEGSPEPGLAVKHD